MHLSLFLLFSFFIFTTMAEPKAPAPLKGYADLHVHMFGNEGFAGAWFLGDSTSKTWEEMFTFCPEGEKTPWLKKLIKKIDPYIASFIYRNHCVERGIPFPAWNDLAHQQVWFGHLKQAHKDGLSLMVLSAVHSYILCRLLPDSRKDFDTCEDRPNIVRQLKSAKALIDRESDWVGLATTPQEARNLAAQGKLAIVFSVETENIFDHPNWAEELEEYWALGVRTLQIVHQFNNKLAGPAVHQKPLIFAQYLRNWLRFSKFEGFETMDESYQTPFGERVVTKNKRGLTEFGKQVVRELMERGMMIDFAHMSEQTMRDVRGLLKPKEYPFYISHGHFRDIMKGKDYGYYEKSASKEVIEAIKEVDGIFGLRTFETGTHTHNQQIENNCDGSSLSFAQAYDYGVKELGVKVAFGSDFNGFIAQTKPRFSSEDAQYCAPQKYPPLGEAFDESGLGRIDQLNSLVRDVKQTGLGLEVLEHSAEHFISVWERSYVKRNQQRFAL